MKYIIKNCPALYMLDIKLGEKIIDTVSSCFEAHCKCEDRTDCLLKQIVEKCKNIECDCLIENMA